MEISKDYLVLQAEVDALISILQSAKTDASVVQNWEKHLENIRKSDSYKRTVHQLDHIMALAEDAADETQATELLHKIPSARIPN